MSDVFSLSRLALAVVSLAGCASAVGCIPSAATGSPPGSIYKNASYCPEARASDLLPLLTWEEKIGQMGGVRRLLGANLLLNETLFESIVAMQNGILGYGNQFNQAADVLEIANQVRQRQMNASLVPFITVTDSVNGPYVAGGTLFPPSLSMAATFNVPYYAHVVAAIREENMALGTRWVLSPELDVPKDARYGRVGETYGEDPFLAGEFGSLYVQTMQERDADGYVKVACTVKHYVYGNPNSGINTAPQYGGINHIFNDDLLPYVKVLRDARPAAVMVSYATIDRVPMSINTWMLQDVLRGRLGFTGVVMSDAGAIPNLHTQSHVAASAGDAAAKAVRAGMQLELAPSQPAAFPSLLAYVNDTATADAAVAARINEAVAGLLALKFATGTFDQPLPSVDALRQTMRAPAHLAINRNISREAVVLLQNQNATLPLAAHQRVALLGPYATIIDAGTYAANNSTNRAYGNALLQSLQAVLGADNVVYERGVDFIDAANASRGIQAAVDAAVEAGLAVVSLGSLAVHGDDPLVAKRTDGEFTAHAELGLPGRQQDLLDAVLDAGVPTVLVLNGGQAFALPNTTLARSAAILHAFLGGEFSADAVAEILVGQVNPSGKLPVSMPQASGATPAAYDYLSSDVQSSWTYPGLSRVVPLAFGFGLSYTTFAYTAPTAVRAWSPLGEPAVSVSVTVTNTGTRDGKEAVQVYFHQEYSTIELPVKRLVGVQKIDLAAGAQQTVSFTIRVEDLGYYMNGDWVRESANYTFLVGSSSRDEDLGSASLWL